MQCTDGVQIDTVASRLVQQTADSRFNLRSRQQICAADLSWCLAARNREMLQAINIINNFSYRGVSRSFRYQKRFSPEMVY